MEPALCTRAPAMGFRIPVIANRIAAKIPLPFFPLGFFQRIKAGDFHPVKKNGETEI